MASILKKFLFLLLTAFPLYAQSPTASREQGLVTGEPFWRQALGGAVVALPSVQAQSAVVALDGGNIKAYSTSGTPLWNYSAGGRLSPFVTRSREGTSYISRNTGTLIAVNRSGRELWRLYPGGQLSGPVISGWDGRLFVPTGKRLFCYTASGNLLWAKTFDASISHSPQLGQDGGIFLALENNEALSINPFGETLTWKLPVRPAALVSLGPEPGGKRSRVMALYPDGALEILGGFEEWYMSVQADITPRPLPRLAAGPLAAVSKGNSVAAVLADGRAVLVSVDEGKILWTGDSHIRLAAGNRGTVSEEAAMFFDERGIYILSRNGATGFTADGRRLWFIFLENTAAIPAFGDDGVLYSGGRDWILYTYKLEDRILPSKQTIYGPAPQGSYGTGNPPPSPWAVSSINFNEFDFKNRLDTISSEIKAGRVGTNELAWTAWLMEIAAARGRPPEIQHRIAALRLLGRIGSRETIPWLTGLFRRESDPAVKAAAALAIGAVGVDPDGVAIQAFFDTAAYSSILMDEQPLTAIAAATGSLCRFSGPPLSEIGVKILTLLSGYTQAPPVRRQAQAEMASLGKK